MRRFYRKGIAVILVLLFSATTGYAMPGGGDRSHVGQPGNELENFWRYVWTIAPQLCNWDWQHYAPILLPTCIYCRILGTIADPEDYPDTFLRLTAALTRPVRLPLEPAWGHITVANVLHYFRLHPPNDPNIAPVTRFVTRILMVPNLLLDYRVNRAVVMTLGGYLLQGGMAPIQLVVGTRGAAVQVGTHQLQPPPQRVEFRNAATQTTEPNPYRPNASGRRMLHFNEAAGRAAIIREYGETIPPMLGRYAPRWWVLLEGWNRVQLIGREAINYQPLLENIARQVLQQQQAVEWQAIEEDFYLRRLLQQVLRGDQQPQQLNGVGPALFPYLWYGT